MIINYNLRKIQNLTVSSTEMSSCVDVIVRSYYILIAKTSRCTIHVDKTESLFACKEVKFINENIFDSI